MTNITWLNVHSDQSQMYEPVNICKITFLVLDVYCPNADTFGITLDLLT